MKNCPRRSSAFILTALISAPAFAQWLDHKTAGIPRTPDGKPNLSAPAANRRREAGPLRNLDGPRGSST